MTTLTIEGKVVGQRAAFERVGLHLDETPGTLGDLLAALVRREVAAFNARQEAGTSVRVLRAEEERVGALVGKIVSGGAETAQRADPDEAVARALRAFEDGLYFVFLDDAQLETLGAPLQVRPSSTLLLLRLTPLAGG